MRYWAVSTLGVGLGLLVGLAGCETTGGNQFESTVYDTHRRVVNLDRSLEQSVERLNVSTAELTARVEYGDQQQRQLHTLIEENTVRIRNLSAELDELKRTVERRFAAGRQTEDMGGVVIEPPRR